MIADGLGGYAMGTADGVRTRRYHALLLVAAPDSERRFVLVNGVEAWVETQHGTMRLTAQRYLPDVVQPAAHEPTFSLAPWPSWGFGRASHEVFGTRDRAATVLGWRLSGGGAARLRVRPLLSGRDWHALHRENASFRFGARRVAGGVRFAPYDGVPPVIAFTNGTYEHAPQWYRQFQYDEERARGQDCIEDLASPGVITLELSPANPEAWLVLTTSPEWGGADVTGDVAAWCRAARGAERARLGAFASTLDRAADAYIVRRGARRTIIAGYPWFTDWGRDTFVSVRGLCIATGRLADAEAILLSWCEHLSDGMMPNLFPSGAGAPEYSSVDASLWFIIAVQDLSAAVSSGAVPQVPLRFVEACEDILMHYARGTRHGIHMDSDGLLAAGTPGLALTWMDAIVDGHPVTPRIGKPVEVQALWVNALAFAGTWNTRWRAAAAHARESFGKGFWNQQRGCLYDVIDVDHVAGAVDDRLRPNQIFACGGLPMTLVEGERATAVTDLVARELWTPMGLRTLARGENGYVGRVDGPMRDRDLGYHQGTVWPWLTCAFLDAWARAGGASPAAAREAAARFLSPLVAHLDAAGVGHVSEIADGDAPHEPRGCPFQAWSVGELLRAITE